MCGIFGIVNFDEKPVLKESLKIMSDKMTHRGPDDEGMLLDDNIGIGMRRLSIIDIEKGHQPISNENNDIHIVLNGEIYNYKELRQDLIQQGHKFSTNSDVEVLVHLYEEYGYECIERLNGMFAFILYDQKNKKVWIARDRLGIKPLFYYHENNQLVVGSDLSSVNSIVRQEIDKYSMILYLGHSYVPAPRTIYMNISKLMPGEQINIENNTIKISKYWDIDNYPEESIEKKEAVGLLREALDESIKLQTRSDVPVGLFLSGGVDSSAVAALTKEVRAECQFHTFTVDFADKGSEDSKYAEEISKEINSIHHIIKVTESDQINALSRLMSKMDEPVSDSAIVPTYIIAEKAKELGVKVMLTGAGGDEIFGGYPRHFNGKFGSAEWLSSLPKLIKKILFIPFYLINKSLYWRLSCPQNNFIYSISGVNVELLKQSTKNPDYYVSLLSDFLKDFKLSLSKNSYDKMKLDFKNYLHNNILSITDKATMAASVEGRVPLLDHNLVELSFKIPEKLNLLDGAEKGLFKESVKDLIPRGIIERKKDGFGAPVYSWIEQWKEAIGIELSINITPELEEVIDIQVVQKWLDNDKLRSRSAETLYALYLLNYWIREHRH
jgi:asparagine synthase (glutamine-hydrolysing)